MKFLMNGEIFKQLVERISGFVPKKSSLALLEYVKIEAKDRKVIVRASDTEEYGTITEYADVSEEGMAWVKLSDLKKVLGIKDMLEISTNGYNSMEVRSAKKSYRITCMDDLTEEWINFDDVEFDSDTMLCRQSDKVFLNHLARLDCMRASNEYSKMALSGFCLDISNSKIVACDGHRIGIANLEGGMFRLDSKSINLSGNIYKKLKSIIGKTKVESYIEIYANKKFVKFVGDGWTIFSRIIEGEYFKYQDTMRGSTENYEYIYTVDGKELGVIAKEYSKNIDDLKKPMVFYSRDGKIATGVISETYTTSDSIESAKFSFGAEKEWYSGFNPRFISDACNIFCDEIEVKGMYSAKYPVYMKDDTYEILILPINMGDDGIGFIEKQIA